MKGLISNHLSKNNVSSQTSKLCKLVLQKQQILSPKDIWNTISFHRNLPKREMHISNQNIARCQNVQSQFQWNNDNQIKDPGLCLPGMISSTPSSNPLRKKHHDSIVNLLNILGPFPSSRKKFKTLFSGTISQQPAHVSSLGNLCISSKAQEWSINSKPRLTIPN